MLYLLLKKIDIIDWTCSKVRSNMFFTLMIICNLQQFLALSVHKNFLINLYKQYSRHFRIGDSTNTPHTLFVLTLQM